MQFDMHRHSADLRAAVYDFDGDASIGATTYRQAMYGGYVSTVTTLCGAADSYGLPVDTETFERWKRMCATAGILDDFIDEAPDMTQAHEAYASGILEIFNIDTPASDNRRQFGWLDARLQPAAQLLRNSVRPIPEARRQKLVAAGLAIGKIALAKAACTELSDYAELLREEALCSSRLIHGSTSPSLANHPAVPAFRRWCDNAFELATFVDSARDLPADAKDNTTAVEPTVLHSLALAWRGRPAYRQMIRRAPERRATISALRSRLGYSLLPTALVMDK